VKLLNYILKSRDEKSDDFYVVLGEKLKIKTKNIQLYKEAFTHSSVNLKTNLGEPLNFERLEFLGDAVLNSIIAEFLFNYYPAAQEGGLTKLRAKIVSRTKLNQIGKKMELYTLAKTSNSQNLFGENIHGNLLESLIGALFTDKGYLNTKDYVIQKIILPNIDVEGLDNLVLSYKALLIEWSQKKKEPIDFQTSQEGGLDPNVNYSSKIFHQKICIAKAKASSKKKAEEKASKIAVRALKIKPKIG
jgi:ribonuclease-3